MRDFYQLHLLFQNYMVQNGYSVREREKLVSPIFPTTFTPSGGPDLAYKFWQGDQTLIGNQIVNQPCIRHWDIELTGDQKHLSFFNMFVADSIHGYPRKQVINHFLEFFTDYLHLDPARFYASYFEGGEVKGAEFSADEEMKQIWLELGIPSMRIMPMKGANAMEAFVANAVEPVGGFRAELFYDMRKNSSPVSSVEEFMELEKQGRILEFFTHVLYNVEVEKPAKTESSEFVFKKMEKQAIAAGFGPQRIMTILEGAGHVGDISILKNLRNCLGHLPKEVHSKEVIAADHIRGLVFLVNDGILDLKGTKNHARKYLFRKYFKNFKKNFEALPLESKEKSLENLTNEAINLFSVLFPEFEKRRAFIVEKIKQTYASTALTTQQMM